VKERVKDFIPKEVVDKIATEEDAKNIEELKAFLKEKSHPVVERWKEEEVVAEVAEEEVEAPAMMPVATAATLPISAGGFKIILKDAKIYAKKVIIHRVEEKKKK